MSDLNMIQARDLPLTIRIEGRVVSLLRRGQLVAQITLAEWSAVLAESARHKMSADRLARPPNRT